MGFIDYNSENINEIDLNVIVNLNKIHNDLDTKYNQITLLENSDFSTGTYRITEPGKYKLSEDIIFRIETIIKNIIKLSVKFKNLFPNW